MTVNGLKIGVDGSVSVICYVRMHIVIGKIFVRHLKDVYTISEIEIRESDVIDVVNWWRDRKRDREKTMC